MTDDPFSTSAPTRTRPEEEAWHEIEELVHRVARLSKSETSRRAFYSQLLEGVVPALGAVAGAIWLRCSGGTYSVEVPLHMDPLGLPGDSIDDRRHVQLIDAVARSGQSRVIPPQAAGPDGGDGANPTSWTALLCPIVREQQTLGLIEVFQRPGISPATQRGYVEFLEALGELAVEFHRNEELRELRAREMLWAKFEQCTREVHAKLDLSSTAYSIANAGRQFLECDRLSVLTYSNRACRVRAVSGMDSIDRRANLIRRMEQLAFAVVPTRQAFWHPGRTRDVPPEVETLLTAYLDEAHSRLLAVVPLLSWDAPREDETSRQAPIGALVIERFSSSADDADLEYRTTALAVQCASAMGNATVYESLPLLRVSQGLQRLAWLTRVRTLRKSVLAGLFALAAISALILVPADFDVEGRGTLQPVVQREVFAGSDGVVQEIKVQHAQRVAAGEVLIVLKKSQLEFEFSRVVGEIQTTQKKLASVQASRLGTSPSNAGDRDQYNKLTAEEEELKEVLKSLAQQERILRAQQQELSARSPIAGQVLTWDIAQLLQARPVHRGQTLLTVADLDGPWVLEVQVPDERVGHILSAQNALRKNLDVSFILSTDPDVTYRGEVEKVALSTDLDENQKPAVLVTVRVDRDKIAQLRPGATVIPKIHCGRKSIGYVWFHDLWDAVKTRLLF